MRQLLSSFPPSCRLCDKSHLVSPVPILPVACWLSWPLGSRLNFVVRNDLDPGLESLEIFSPLLDRLDYCQHLFLGYGIVLFCACHFL